MTENKNSRARIEANKRYNANAYDRINVIIPKGQKPVVEAHAQAQGETVNSLVNHLLQADLGLSDEDWKNPKK